jgi:cytochrome c5
MQKIVSSAVIVLLSVVIFSSQSCKHKPEDIPLASQKDTSTANDTSIVGVKCDPDSVYFENSILPLITSSCAYTGCHDAASRQDGVVLDNYANIMNTGKVKPGNPNGSSLYEVITETRADKVMPPPPNSTLTNEQKALIQKWIQQGAKNNKCVECDSTNVTYAVQVTSIMDANCVACHNATSASGNVSLHNYTAVKTNVDNGKLSGAINHLFGYAAMPPSGKMNECNLTIIKKWIDNGAPNN